jgi:hypothetical protein
MRKVGWVAVLVAMVPYGAMAAPRALYGKSVKVSWTETRSQRNPGETAFHPVGLPFVLTFYVGTEGHVFKRLFSVGSTGKARGSQDKVGGGGNGGGASSFSGNTLTVTSAFGGAARRMQITFDGNFSGCTAQVITGKLSGAKSATVRSVATGNMVEFESVSAGPASCAVSEGNAFGS